MRKQKASKIFVIACEGDAEINLFGYLKISIHKKLTTDLKPSLRTENLGGFNSQSEFEKEYKDLMKKYDLNDRSKLIQFVFLFDNDLSDSHKIKSFLEKQEHLVTQLDPNIEGFILELIGKTITGNNRTELFRKQCKEKFKKEFGVETHRMKTKDWDKIFGKDCCNINSLIKNNPELESLVKIIKG